MEKKIKGGVFITFEGPEGSGKSTQSDKLTETLINSGFDVLHTAEPGGTLLGKKIRSILLGKEEIPVDAHSELMLFEADRAQHVRESIKPALEAGKIVICDRFNTATFAYQGYGLGMDLELIRKLDDIATGGLSPDLTLLLDIDIKTGLERAGRESVQDRMEKRSLEFHERVRLGYLNLAEKNSEKIKVIEVNNDIDGMFSIIKDLVYDFIEGR